MKDRINKQKIQETRSLLTSLNSIASQITIFLEKIEKIDQDEIEIHKKEIEIHKQELEILKSEFEVFKEHSKHHKALVRTTWVLSFATVFLFLATAALTWASIQDGRTNKKNSEVQNIHNTVEIYKDFNSWFMEEREKKPQFNLWSKDSASIINPVEPGNSISEFFNHFEVLNVYNGKGLLDKTMSQTLFNKFAILNKLKNLSCHDCILAKRIWYHSNYCDKSNGECNRKCEKVYNGYSQVLKDIFDIDSVDIKINRDLQDSIKKYKQI